MSSESSGGSSEAEHGFAIRVEVVDGHHRLIATAAHAPGQRILRFEGDLVDHPGRLSLQVDEHTHVDLPVGVPVTRAARTHPWVFLNHSCDPTAVRRGPDLVALRAIEPDDEISFDYLTTEWELAAPFRCRCGSPRCRQEEIRGFRHLSRAEQERRRPHLSPHLLARLDAPPSAESP